MEFKKDYINFVFNGLLESDPKLFNNKQFLKNIFHNIIKANDLSKITFVIGKTSGLEILFKYLLYISDKIDKLQITIFNIKENYEYDVNHLARICSHLNFNDTIKTEPEISEESDTLEKELNALVPEAEQPKTIIRDYKDITETENTEIDADNRGMQLIENDDTELNMEEIDEIISDNEKTTEDINEEELISINQSETAEEPEDDQALSKEEYDEIRDEATGDLMDEEVTKLEDEEKIHIETNETDKELEIEIVLPFEDNNTPENSHENEAYYRFEEKFFIESKILEKLFNNIITELKGEPVYKLNDRMVQSCREIIAITNNLSNITRKLSFDLTADILVTMGLYFSRVMKYPQTLTTNRIYLMKDALKLIAALVKNENYLNYDKIIDMIEEVKNELMHKPSEEPKIIPDKVIETKQEKKLTETEQDKKDEKIISKREQFSKTEDSHVRSFSGAINEQDKEPENKETRSSEAVKSEISEMTDEETIIFKMKYLVKDFEKNFEALGKLSGEYSRYDVLESINELNNNLRMMARIGKMINSNDVVRLCEVTYIFLKYIKDYRMNLLDQEIKQIIHYVIFCFKMLLTNRRPEDFNVLVDYLNNPVKIFADT